MIKTAAAAAPRAKIWAVIVLLTAIDAYAFVDASVLALLVDPVKRHLLASDLQMGLMLGSAYAALYGIFNLPAGHYVDRFNRTRLILLASLGWTVMTIVCGTAHSLSQLVVGRMGIGISQAVLMPAIFSMIRDSVGPRWRGTAFAIYAMSPMVGTGVSLWGGAALLRLANDGALNALPSIGGFLPWQQTMIVIGLAGLPLSALLLFVREPPRHADPDYRCDSLYAALAAAARYMSGRRRLYLPLIAFTVFSTMETFAVGSWLPTAMSRHLETSPETIGPLLGMLSFACGIAGLSLTALAMRAIAYRGKNPMALGAVLCVATAITGSGAVLVSGAGMSYLFAALCNMTLGASLAVAAAVLADITDDRLMGRVSAIYFLFQNLVGQSAGPLIVAAIGGFFTGGHALSYALALSLVGTATCATISATLLSQRVIRVSA